MRLLHAFIQLVFWIFYNILLLPVAHKYFQVLHIRNAIAERRRAYVAERLILAPGSNEYNQVIDIYISVVIKVNDWFD